MSQPTVSVVVPTYNHAEFLPETLTSIFAQTWPHLDVIVVDDGSTDHTMQVLESWRARGVRVVQQANQGVSAARNRGIAMAAGDFIAFLDSDDLWPRADMLEAAIRLFEDQPDLGWTFGDAQPFAQQDGQRVILDEPYLKAGGYYATAHEGGDRVVVTPSDLCNNDRFFIPTGTLLIRKQCFAEVGSFDAGLKMFEDTDMWMRLLAYPLVFFPSVLLLRRVHGSNISHRRWAYLDDLRTLFERYDLSRHGVSFAFHAARAHYGAGREAWQKRRFAQAAGEFRAALRYRRALKPALFFAASWLASLVCRGEPA